MDRGFTAEISSKRHVKNVSISNEAHDRVLFEGVFGELREVYMVDDRVLEIKGGQVKFGIEAPARVAIHREEVYLRILEENRRAAAEAPAELGTILDAFQGRPLGE